MKKTLMIVLSAMLGFCSMWADVLSPAESLARAQHDLQAKAPRMAAAAQTSQAEVVYTEMDANMQPAAYVYDFNGGYMVLSADSQVPAVIGYSESAKIEPSAMPDGLAYMLGEYAKEIEFARQQGIIVRPRYVAGDIDQKTPIFPLVKTKWNQDAPFNNLCPVTSGEMCVTGCVATAMSQVLNYHKYPEHGYGQNSYTTSTLGISQSFNFAATTFDWDNMLDVYGSGATAAQNSAVATLMKAAGVSVNMDYNVSSKGGSGARSSDIPNALITYFGYDQCATIEYRDYYSLDEWEDLIYTQLKDNGPVIYDGQSNSGGHSFVCDGYGGNGYFHFNWGWGGMSDGYFLLNLLDPGSQGIGGSTSGFNFSQDIVCNIKKPGDTPSPRAYKIAMTSDFSFGEGTFALGSSLVSTNYAYNYSGVTIPSVTYGVKIKAADGTLTYAFGFTATNLEPTYGYKVSTVLPSSLADGTYIMTPGWKDADGYWRDIQVPVGKNQEVSMIVSNGNATITTMGSAYVTYSNQSITPVYQRATYRYTCTVNNPSAYNYINTVCVIFLNSSNNLVAMSDNALVDLEPNSTMQLEIESSYMYAATGDLYYALAYQQGSSLYFLTTKTPVTVDVLTESPALNFGAIQNAYGYANNVNTEIPSNKLKFTIDVNCTAGFYGDKLEMYLFPYTSGSVSSVAYTPTSSVILQAGESATAEFEFDFTGTPGSKYFIQGRYVYYDPSAGTYYAEWIADQFCFTYGAPDDQDLLFSNIYPVEFAIGEEANVKFKLVNPSNVPLSRTVVPVIYDHSTHQVVMKGVQQEVALGIKQTNAAYTLSALFEPVDGAVIEPSAKYDVTLLDAQTGEVLILAMSKVTLKTTNFSHSINASHARTLFYSNYNLKLPDEVGAYAYFLQGGEIEMRSLRGYYNTDIIPAGVAVMLWSETEGDYKFTLVDGDNTTVDLANACLGGTDEDETISNAANMHYILGVGSKGLGWYKASADGHTVNNGAHKAYLKIPVGVSTISYIPINVEDEVTGRVSINLDSEDENGPAYNVQGIEVKDKHKGIIIKNGQKVYNK